MAKKSARKPKEVDVVLKRKVNKAYRDLKAAHEKLEMHLKKLRMALDDGTYSNGPEA